MPVLSDIPQHSVETAIARREDFDDLLSVWTRSRDVLNHSRGPGVIAAMSGEREITLWKLLDGEGGLVAYIPLDVNKMFGVTIYRPAFNDLTLDFIDLCVIDEWRDFASDIFCSWIREQDNAVVDLFMISEESHLVISSQDYSDLIVVPRGMYFNIELPDTLDAYMNTLGKSTRSKVKRTLKSKEGLVQFEVITCQALGDQISEAFEQLVELHSELFPSGSMFLPHKKELRKYVKAATRDNTWAIFRARDNATGAVIAIDLYMMSERAIGLYQGGRRVGDEYNNIGNWMMIQCIEWAIKNSKERFEFLFGDQDYKKRLASGAADAVSLTYFSNSRARYTYRIRQRLGRYIPALR